MKIISFIFLLIGIPSLILGIYDSVVGIIMPSLALIVSALIMRIPVNHSVPDNPNPAEIPKSKTLVYSPKDRTIECNGVVYDFYCGDDLDERAILLSDLVFGHTTLQNAWIRAARFNGGPL